MAVNVSPAGLGDMKKKKQNILITEKSSRGRPITAQYFTAQDKFIILLVSYVMSSHCALHCYIQSLYRLIMRTLPRSAD